MCAERLVFAAALVVRRNWCRVCLMSLMVAWLPPVMGATPAIEQWETSHGARVLFVATHALPMVDVRLVFDAGSARDGDHPGLATLANGLLFEGAGELDADAIAAGFDDLGVSYGASAARDMASVTLRTLSDAGTLRPAIDLLATVLAKADYPQAAVDRERSNLLLGLRAEQQQPGQVAARAFYQALYGGHPYAHMPSGDADSVAALQPSQLRQFKARYYVAANAVIALVGDLTMDQARRVAETLASALPTGVAAAPLPIVPPVATPVSKHIDFPSTQTHVLLGQPGMTRTDADYVPLYVGNHVLGGSGLVSQIAEQVREKRGLAYSAYSYFHPLRRRGPWIAGLQTRNDKADEAVALLRQTVAGFIAEGPGRDALARSKQNIIGGFPLRIDSNAKVLGYLGMIGFYGLPLDYLQTFPQRVARVTGEDVRRAFARRLNPDRMVLVTVGGGKAHP